MKSGNRTRIIVVVTVITEHESVARIDNKRTAIRLLNGRSPQPAANHIAANSQHRLVNTLDIRRNLFRSSEGW